MTLRFAVRLAAVGLAASMLAGAVDAAAKKGKGKNVGKVDKQVEVAPEGLRWGLTLEGITKVYSDYLDASYLKLYRKTQPGPELEALEAEVGDKKKLLKRNLIIFGETPTGIDQTGLKGEYSYRNGESMTRMIVNPTLTRNFFFFNNKLWKIYDEYEVSKGGPLGSNFEEAVTALKKIFGSEPERLEPDYANGRSFPEARWRTNTMLIRAVGRDPTIGLVYSNLTIEQELPSRRKNREHNPQALDPAVRSATSK